ncbi:hypothetical protein [Streptomyces beigongshangae]|uniref:hypothetical protein n=1 Tax=Streptomyces beigongshangae TaxID=2841597 RepID=UPI001C8483C5|nr:hypothetical protein [Streptomyces sp. REN17]
MTARSRMRGLVRRGPRHGPADVVGRVCSELALDLPDEDLGEYLHDCVDLYEMGSRPRCEEAEFLGMVREAIDRIERGE